MKKLLLSLVAAVLLIAPAASLEWGGVAKGSATAKTKLFGTVDYSAAAETYLWTSLPFGETGFDFIAEGYMRMAANITDIFDPNFIIDLDLLKFSYTSNLFKASAGRFIFSDLTGEVLNQNVDGARILFNFPVVNLSAYAGYTGFLNELNVFMVNSEGNAISPIGRVYNLAYPYFIGGASALFPVIFGNQSFGIEGLAALDLVDFSQSRYYANVKLSGPLGSIFSYDLMSSFGSVNFANLMNYTAVNFSIYAGSSVVFDIGAEYASGNFAIFSPFAGITSNLIGENVMQKETTKALSGKIGMSIITNSLVIFSTTSAIFDMPAEEITLSGVQQNFSINLNLFHDLQIYAGAYGFVDIMSLIGGDFTKNDFGANVGVALSF
ncbi:MAG: hypothetical protein MJ179_08955 [Treponema sp.]|nr:hypothetical protein [Treponema sp.]